MARTVCMAVAFMLTSALAEANQCSSGNECTSSSKPQNAVSLLQTKLQMNVLEEGGEEILTDGASRAEEIAYGIWHKKMLSERVQKATSLDGLQSSMSSDQRIRSYLSKLYHEDLENKPEWREKWNETEMVYRNIGHHLEAVDFPPSLGEKWKQFAAGSGPGFGGGAGYMPMNLKRQLAPNDTWVEVIRRWSIVGEGTSWAHGSCWFYQFKGSGVWLNVGRTATFDGNHAFAVEQMQTEIPALQSISGDNVLTAYAHAKGLDTIQTSYSKDEDHAEDGNMPELIHFGGSCRNTSIKTGCIPGLEMRTGLSGNLPCICKEYGLLNCDGSSVSAPLALLQVESARQGPPHRHVLASVESVDKGPPPGHALASVESVMKTDSLMWDKQQLHVLASVIVVLLLMVAALVRQSLLPSESPIAWAGLSCMFFGLDNFLIADSGRYLKTPNAHMALVLLFMAVAAVVLHIVLWLVSSEYAAQTRTTLNSPKLALMCVALTGIFVAGAEVASNTGFSKDLPNSGPLQALSCCNVLVVCPFCFWYFGEQLTKVQLFGCGLLFAGSVSMSDVPHWSSQSVHLQSFLWLLLAMLCYSASDITLRFASNAQIPWQPQVLLILMTMGAMGFPLFAKIGEEDGFNQYHESPSLVVRPLLNAVAGVLGLLCVTRAFESTEAPTGVLSSVVNANSVVLVVMNKAILGYTPSAPQMVGMCFILFGVSVFHVGDKWKPQQFADPAAAAALQCQAAKSG